MLACMSIPLYRIKVLYVAVVMHARMHISTVGSRSHACIHSKGSHAHAVLVKPHMLLPEKEAVVIGLADHTKEDVGHSRLNLDQWIKGI